MMGRQKSDQGQLFYEFCIGDAVPEDHLVRKIDAALDLSWLRGEIDPHYWSMGGPPIAPEPLGAADLSRSTGEPRLSGSASSALRTLSLIIRHFRAPVTSASERARFSVVCSSGLSRPVYRPAWSAEKALRSMRA